MQVYEYKVVPAPRRGEKERGARSVPERFAVALTHAMNDLARDGWEYLRADTLPCEERVGLTGTATHFQNMLVFRRALARPAEPRNIAPKAAPPMPVPEPAPVPDEDATFIMPMQAQSAPMPKSPLPPLVAARPNGRS